MRALHKGHGSEIDPVVVKRLLGRLGMFGPMGGSF